MVFLQLFDFASVLQNVVEPLNFPALHVPRYFFRRLVRIRGRNIGDQKPLDGRLALQRCHFHHVDQRAG
ncbi:hypothetical protein D3C75_786590 [compost metagenome]